MKAVPIAPCFGVSLVTGKGVWSRHRWPSGMRIGTCLWCGRTEKQLQDRAKLDEAMAIMKRREQGLT